MKKYACLLDGGVTIHDTWEECKTRTWRAGVIYSKFETQEALDAFIAACKRWAIVPTEVDDVCSGALLVATDGSRNNINQVGWGIACFERNPGWKRVFVANGLVRNGWEKMWNVGGELMAVVKAIEYAKWTNIPIIIVHDYAWALGYILLGGNCPTTREYAKYVLDNEKWVKGFIWTPGHLQDSGILAVANNQADAVAGRMVEDHPWVASGGCVGSEVDHEKQEER